MDRLRKICLALPEAAEGISVHHPSFKVRGKTFVMFADGDGRSAAWIKSTLEAQTELLAEAGRFFKPPYLGPKGWLGVYLDHSPDWTEIAELVNDGWRLAAPKRLLR